MASMRSKILTSYGLSKIALLAFVAVVIADLHYIQTHISEGEAVNGFYVASQEARHGEKNLFLYHDPADLIQLQQQLDVARQHLNSSRQLFIEIVGRQELQQIDKLLERYRGQLQNYLNTPAVDRPRMQQMIRESGHRLSTLARDLSKRQRAIVSDTLRLATWTLMAASLTVILIGLASALFMVRRVVRPLRQLEEQLDTVAEGREKALTLVSEDQEIQSFVTHFNTMLDRLREQQSQLTYHEKAAALGVLVSGVAHELNNPLSNISTSVQLLLEDDGSTDAELRQQWLAYIDGESERARRIVRRLLESVRHPTLHVKAISVVDLIDSSIELVQRQLPDNIQVNYMITSERMLYIDRERMQQVFINLIKNASNAGATQVWIDARESTWLQTREGKTDYLVGDTAHVSTAPSIVYFEVNDNGPGIATDNLSHIFDPFFTTNSKGDGTGLGLYLVEEIISEHNGCIAVENRLEGGTGFSIWLPQSTAQELS